MSECQSKTADDSNGNLLQFYIDENRELRLKLRTQESVMQREKRKAMNAGFGVFVIAVILCFIIFLLLSFVPTAEAKSRVVKPRKVPHCQSHKLSPPAAVRCVFPARAQAKALRVMWCESKNNPRAKNGQYRGLFQMGSRERATYAYTGYSTPLQQVQAAHNLWTWRGWQPWSCQ